MTPGSSLCQGARRRAALSTSAALLALGGLSCTYDSDPLLHPDTVGLPLEIVQTSPAAGALDVPINRPIDIVFNQALSAETVTPLRVRVFAGLIESFGTVRVDLLERSIRFTPTPPLRPNLRHQVYLHRGIRGLGGRALGENQVFDLSTGDASEPTPPEEPAVVTAGDLQPLWEARCAHCHAPPSPAAGVDLDTVDGAVGSLVGRKASHGRLLRVHPSNHARSYLMLKLLGEGGFVGFRMPPDGAALDRARLRRVADWIDGGARR